MDTGSTGKLYFNISRVHTRHDQHHAHYSTIEDSSLISLEALLFDAIMKKGEKKGKAHNLRQHKELIDVDMCPRHFAGRKMAVGIKH